jgi:hypothetical protein
MKFIFTLLLALAAIFVAWPYGTFYQLSGALKNNHQADLQKLVDLDAIRKNYQQDMAYQMQHGAVGQWMGQSDAAQLIRGTVQNLAQAGTEQTITLDWLRDNLVKQDHHYENISEQLSFAFFENPEKFLIRLGELGQHPQHLYLSWQPWHFPDAQNQLSWTTWFQQYALQRWRLTAVYL